MLNPIIITPSAVKPAEEGEDDHHHQISNNLQEENGMRSRHHSSASTTSILSHQNKSPHQSFQQSDFVPDSPSSASSPSKPSSSIQLINSSVSISTPPSTFESQELSKTTAAVQNASGSDNLGARHVGAIPPEMFRLPRAFFSFPPSPLSFLEVTKNLSPQFLAAFVNTVLFFLSGNLIMASVGRNVDTLSLAAIGAGISLNNILGYAISIGFAAALDTLCSAAYGRLKRAKDRKQLKQKEQEKEKNEEKIIQEKSGEIHNSISISNNRYGDDKKDDDDSASTVATPPRVEEIGELTLLAMGLCSCLCIPFAIVFWNAEPLVAIIFGDQYTALTSLYLKYAIPNLFFASWASCVTKSCQAQQRADLPVIATVATVLLSVVTSLHVVPRYGVEGAAFAITLNSIVIFVMIFVLAILDGWLFDREKFDDEEEPTPLRRRSSKKSKHLRLPSSDQTEETGNDDFDDAVELQANNTSAVAQETEIETNEASETHARRAHKKIETPSHKKPEVLLLRLNWFRPNLRRIYSWENITSFSVVGFDTAKAISSEWLCFEIWLLISSRLGENAFAAFQVFMSIAVICFAFAAALGIAASSHTGKLLGEGKAVAAFTHGKTCVIWAGVLGVFSAFIVQTFHETIFDFYTHDPAVKLHLKNVLVVFYLLVICDHTQYTIQAAFFRGTNKNSEAPKIVLTTLWLIGLPLSYLFSLKYDLPGLIFGYCFGLAIEIPLLLRKANTFDWNELVALATKENIGANKSDNVKETNEQNTSAI